MTDTFKLAVVGYESSIMLYRAIGADTFAVADVAAARETVEKVAARNRGDEAKTPEYAIIFVEQNFYQELPPELIDKLSRKALPALIPVPSPEKGDENFGKKRLSSIVERAVGSDIFGN